jgi:UDP-glucose 4-epimerase
MILVTGGAGYIGSHTVVEMLTANLDLLILDNFSNSSPKVVDAIERIADRRPLLVEGDVRDKAGLRKVFSDHPIGAVIHFAGLKAVGESVEKPLEYYENNLGTTFSLVRAMRRHGVRRLVFSSSATVYGPTPPLPMTEDLPTSATNPYGWTKVMQECAPTGLK